MRVVIVYCFYAVVVRGIPDGQANVDGMDCGFRRVKVRYVPGIHRSTQYIWSAKPSVVNTITLTLFVKRIY